MQKRWLLFVVLALCAASATAQTCQTPVNGAVLASDTLLCTGTYTLPQGLRLSGGVVLDCAGATLQGTTQGTGISVEGDDVQVRNCRIERYAIGLRASNVLNFIEDGLTFADNGEDRSISQGEDLVIPPAEDVPVAPVQPSGQDTPVVAPVQPTQPLLPDDTGIEPPAPIPPLQPKPRNPSIWLIADIQSEQLLEQALSYEYPTGRVPQGDLALRVAQLQQTLGDVRIEREFLYRDGKTEVRITIKPQRGFFSKVVYENVTLYEYIPKCFAQLVDEVVFEGEQPQVLEADPLLKKVVRKEDGLRFSYSAFKTISPECKELFRIIGIGEGRRLETAGSVLAERGIGQVVVEFPAESAAVATFVITTMSLGLWYKKALRGLR